MRRRLALVMSAVAFGLVFSYGMVLTAPSLRVWGHVILGLVAVSHSIFIGVAARRDGRHGIALLAVLPAFLGVMAMVLPKASDIATGAILVAALVAVVALLSQWRVQVVFTRRPSPGKLVPPCTTL